MNLGTILPSIITSVILCFLSYITLTARKRESKMRKEYFVVRMPRIVPILGLVFFGMSAFTYYEIFPSIRAVQGDLSKLFENDRIGFYLVIVFLIIGAFTFYVGLRWRMIVTAYQIEFTPCFMRTRSMRISDIKYVEITMPETFGFNAFDRNGKKLFMVSGTYRGYNLLADMIALYIDNPWTIPRASFTTAEKAEEYVKNIPPETSAKLKKQEKNIAIFAGICSAAIVIFTIFLAAFNQSGETSYAKTFLGKASGVHIGVAESWKRIYDDELAAVQLVDGKADRHLSLYEDEKSSFKEGMALSDYAAFVQEIALGNIEKAESSVIKDIIIGDNIPAKQFEIIGSFEQFSIAYIITCFETREYFCQLDMFTSSTQIESAMPEFEEILNGIKFYWDY